MEPDLSVIVPAYNEAATIEEILRRVWNAPLRKEIIVVDDGSNDATAAIVERLQNEITRLRLIRHEKNRGKGAAVRTGIALAKGRAVIIQDADLEYDPADYLDIVRPILIGEAEVVYGSRVLGNAPHSSLAFYLGGRLVTLVTNALYGSSLTDEPTCYKAFKRELLQSFALRERGFGFCAEVTAKVLLGKHPIREVPISYKPRDRAHGKKITWKDGLRTVWVLMKNRFGNTGAGTCLQKGQ